MGRERRIGCTGTYDRAFNTLVLVMRALRAIMTTQRHKSSRMRATTDEVNFALTIYYDIHPKSASQSYTCEENHLDFYQ